jgi:penicillin-insensitive murein endopeptidase
MSQPRGGPMLTGHASHQVGLDVDVWLTPMPARRLTEQEREDMSAISVVEVGPHEVYADRWSAALGRMIRRAALDPRVERIFVAPGIKKRLCETAGNDRGWLRQVRPYYGHNDHIHVRLSCPPGTPCRAQSPPPPGDGCGADLDWWYTAEPYKPSPPSNKPPREIMLRELPAACRNVLLAEPVGGAVTMRQAFNAALGLASPPQESAGVPYVATELLAEGMLPARLPRPRPEGR